jgi:hypothetical protein
MPLSSILSRNQNFCSLAVIYLSSDIVLGCQLYVIDVVVVVVLIRLANTHEARAGLHSSPQLYSNLGLSIRGSEFISLLDSISEIIKGVRSATCDALDSSRNPVVFIYYKDSRSEESTRVSCFCNTRSVHSYCSESGT